MNQKDKIKKGDLKGSGPDSLKIDGSEKVLEGTDQLLEELEDLDHEVEGFHCGACDHQNYGCPRRQYWDKPLDQVPEHIVREYHYRDGD